MKVHIKVHVRIRLSCSGTGYPFAANPILGTFVVLHFDGFFPVPRPHLSPLQFRSNRQQRKTNPLALRRDSSISFPSIKGKLFDIAIGTRTHCFRNASVILPNKSSTWYVDFSSECLAVNNSFTTTKKLLCWRAISGFLSGCNLIAELPSSCK